MAYLRHQGAKDEELEALRAYGGAAQAQQVPTDDGPAPAAPTSGPSPSGQYTNFDRLYAANADAAKATAGQMRQGVESSAQKAQQGLGGLQHEFNQRVTGGALSQMPGQGQQQTAGGVAAVTSARPESGPAGTTYTGPPGQTNVDQWRTYSQAKYTGPDSLEALQRYGQVAADTREAQRQLGATASQEGREALLRRQASAGGYTRGQSRFDAGLTGYAGGPGFEETRKRYGDLEKALTDANAASRGSADRARGFTEQAAKAYGGMVSDWEKSEAARQATEAAKAAEAKGLGTQAGAVSFGGTANAGGATSELPDKAFTEVGGDSATWNRMSAEERAQWAALRAEADAHPNDGQARSTRQALADYLAQMKQKYGGGG